MRRRLIAGLFGTFAVLGLALAPARASLFDSVRGVVVRIRDVLPVRIGLKSTASLTPAERDSVRRARLARLASLAGERPPAWADDFVLLPRGVELRFTVSDTVSRDVIVHRREPRDGWHVVGRVRVDKQRHGAWRDTTSRAGKLLELALGLRTSHGTRFVPMPPVELPGGGLRLTASLAADGTTTLVLRLPTGYPATLELFDVAGRAMGAIDISGFAAGTHTVRVPATLLPGRGVYFARLSQRGDWATEKVVVVR